jgi:hypothetical protein
MYKTLSRWAVGIIFFNVQFFVFSHPFELNPKHVGVARQHVSICSAPELADAHPG